MDLMTSDTARAREFYGRVFGWHGEAASEEFGGYFMFMLNGAPVAGCMPAPPEVDVADVWGVYLTTPDASATAEKTVALGGILRVPPTPVADLGTQAILDDPAGARIGLWQADTFPGFGPIGSGRPGAPDYFELHARDYAGSVAFYRDAFGWDAQVISDTPDLRVTAITEGGKPVAGILDSGPYLAAGEGPSWGVYLTVDDADKTVSLVAELGGTVHQEAIDTPFGRLGMATDPMGARIWVVSR
jgi:predicted enzyme related to lactoylglutathione lyase